LKHFYVDTSFLVKTIKDNKLAEESKGGYVLHGVKYIKLLMFLWKGKAHLFL